MTRPADGHLTPGKPSPAAGCSRMKSTIRTVRSFDSTDDHRHDRGRPCEEDDDPGFSSVDDDDDEDDDDDDDDDDNTTAPSTGGFSSSLNSNTSGMSAASHARPQQQPRSEPQSKTVGKPAARIKKGSDRARPSVDIPQRDSSLSARTMNGNSPEMGHSDATTPPVDGINGWDSSVGKAGLGKTGRVINKLVSDNEALRRDIKIERLRAEEAKQAARLLEDKMSRLESEYESRLVEATVTKTLLARKERQVESLQGAVELERRRAQGAAERERSWKDELERTRAEAKKQVEEAAAHAALMEGRYNAISSHWREQGAEVDRAIGKVRAEMAELALERHRDDDRIGTLRDVCDQQDGNIRALRAQKDAIAAQFAAYKDEQERLLADIKGDARRREEEQERTLRESKDVLDKLKWALSVRENIKWAE